MLSKNELKGHFAIQYTQSDLYPVQRLATVARNFVVCTTHALQLFTNASKSFE